jgi:hypothetical protein
MTKTTINERVNVTSVYFQNKQLRTFPRRIELHNGTTYTFRDGWQYVVKKGEEIIRIFDMSDGDSHYRLTCPDNQSDWTLVAITQEA